MRTLIASLLFSLAGFCDMRTNVTVAPHYLATCFYSIPLWDDSHQQARFSSNADAGVSFQWPTLRPIATATLSFDTWLLSVLTGERLPANTRVTDVGTALMRRPAGPVTGDGGIPFPLGGSYTNWRGNLTGLPGFPALWVLLMSGDQLLGAGNRVSITMDARSLGELNDVLRENPDAYEWWNLAIYDNDAQFQYVEIENVTLEVTVTEGNYMGTLRVQDAADGTLTVKNAAAGGSDLRYPNRWRKGSDLVIELADYIDADEAAITGATVSANLYDEADDSLVAGPITLTESGSIYRGFVDGGTSVALGQQLRCEMTADTTTQGHGLKLVQRLTVVEE